MTRHKWTDAQIDMVRDRYITEDTTTLAAEIGCTRAGLYMMAKKLNIQKPMNQKIGIVIRADFNPIIHDSRYMTKKQPG